MDSNRFDDLTRSLAGGTSRRRMLKGLLGGAGAGALSLVGTHRAAAVARPVGATCIRPTDCTSGVCDRATRRCICPPSLVVCNRVCVNPASYATDAANCGGCGRVCPGGVCAGGTCGAVLGVSCLSGGACASGNCVDGVCCAAASCAPLDSACQVGVCQPGFGGCATENRADGTHCDDGNACTQTDTCQAGICVGSNPVVCAALDQCHDVGVCNSATGICSNPNKTDGAACTDGNACTQTDTCQTGVCTGGNPVVCTASDQCHQAGSCNPATGICSNPTQPDTTPCDDGDATTCNDTCQTGVCTGGPCQEPCADGREVCGAVCCATGEGCVSGVCRTNCGATTCDASTQICCASLTCCDRATAVCGSLAGTCTARAICDPAAVYMPATNTCCFAANVCGEACCQSGSYCYLGSCRVPGGGGGGGGIALQ